MRHPILTLLLGLVLLVTAGCGFHLRNTTQVPSELQKMLLESSDPYGPLTRSLRQQLRLNNVEIIDDAKRNDLPTLRILSSTETQDTVSIFLNGTTAESQLILQVQAQVLIPGRGIYPLTVTQFHSFLNNPLTALAKEAENEIIRHEMREQAAQQLVRKLLTVDAKKIDNTQNTKNTSNNNALNTFTQ